MRRMDGQDDEILDTEVFDAQVLDDRRTATCIDQCRIGLPPTEGVLDER